MRLATVWQWMGGWGGLLLGAAYLVGIGFLGFGLAAAYWSTQATHWPTTPGTITAVTLDSESNPTNGSPSYQVKVRYTYQVGTAAYEGSRLAFGYGLSGGQATHQAIEAKLRAAPTVLVRYDPHHPEVACLSSGLHRTIQIMLAFGAFWFSTVLACHIGFRSLRSEDRVVLDSLEINPSASSPL